MSARTNRAEVIVECFDLPEQVLTSLRDALYQDGEFEEATSAGGVFGFLHAYTLHIPSTVLLPIAGAIGKSVLDVVIDRVKQWLAEEKGDRKITIYGPDGEVVRIVKAGDKITH